MNDRLMLGSGRSNAQIEDPAPTQSRHCGVKIRICEADSADPCDWGVTRKNASANILALERPASVKCTHSHRPCGWLIQPCSYKASIAEKSPRFHARTLSNSNAARGARAVSSSFALLEFTESPVGQHRILTRKSSM